jgi:hypothetical protein
MHHEPSTCGPLPDPGRRRVLPGGATRMSHQQFEVAQPNGAAGDAERMTTCALVTLSRSSPATPNSAQESDSRSDSRLCCEVALRLKVVLRSRAQTQGCVAKSRKLEDYTGEAVTNET